MDICIWPFLVQGRKKSLFSADYYHDDSTLQCQGLDYYGHWKRNMPQLSFKETAFSLLLN